MTFERLAVLYNDFANLQRELARTNAQLQRMDERKNELLGMVAHDLRNPLNSICLHASLMLRSASDRLTLKEAKALAMIEASSQSMGRLIDDLLSFSALESGKLSLENELTNLARLVEDNLALSSILAERRGITIETELDPGLPRLSLDPLRIDQVLNNLLGNAISHSPDGSTVAVRVAREGDEVAVRVRDSGPGVPAETAESLFKPFVRGPVSEGLPAPPRLGVGLGLAIARRIVEDHGGRLWVESPPGGPATFGFALPVG